MDEVFLSRLRLDPRRRETQRALADCARMHQQVLAAFPVAATASPRDEFGVLYRVELDSVSGAPSVLVQSTRRPDWAASGMNDLGATVDGPKEVGRSYAGFATGTRLRFRLKANPTRRVHRNRAGADPLAGKRVAVRGEAALREWLRRQEAQHGFVVVAAEVKPDGALGSTQRGRRVTDGGARSLAFGAVVFEGILRVTDPEALQRALRAGIGSGKAYGFGLLSVGPEG